MRSPFRSRIDRGAMKLIPNGRVRRVGIAAACTLTTIATLSGQSTAATQSNAALPTTTVRVVTTEYKFALSRKTVPVGTVIFVIVNKGQLPHNMAFNGPVVYKRAPLVDPGSFYRFKVVFKKPGTYRFVCSPHFKLGMASQITAKK
jgi:plastocyanin